MADQRHAYVTLVTNPDFAKGARALARSIQACGATAPLWVMSTYEGAEVEALRQWGAKIVPVCVPEVSAAFCARHGRAAVHAKNPFTKGTKPAFHDPLNNFAKLRLWQLTDLDRAVFLDADTLMLRPCDRLFAYPEFAAAPNVYEGLGDFFRLNSGVFVAAPCAATYGRMIEVLDAPEAYWPRTDQTFLQAFFPDWHGLPHIYNTLQYVSINLPELWNVPATHVLHYQYEKPWQRDHPKAAQLQPLIDLWWQVYEQGSFPDLSSL